MYKIVIIFCILASTTLYAQIYIEQWGQADYHGWPILNDSTTLPGYASMGGDTRDDWASLRGSFGQDVAISKHTAIVVSGQIEFIGGSGGDDSMPIRYALTYQTNEGEILYAGTDSAQWSVNGGHYGYSFHPRTGSYNGEGTVWTIINGNWCSTYSNNGWLVAAINQVPRNAELVAGLYNFAISVHIIDDTTNEIRWYMVEENENYWFGGMVQDTAMTTVFNGVEFGINGGEYTHFNVIAMSVDLGDPIYPPESQTYYIEYWGIIGDRFAGWKTIPGELAGDFSISGDTSNTGIAAIRGELFDNITLNDDYVFIIKGELNLERGGFGASNSLRFGLFYCNDPGLHIINPPDSMRWTGSEDNHSGYLFIPPSGTNSPPLWGTGEEFGNWGAVINNVWFEPQADNNYALGGAMQYPQNAMAGEGTYDFEISISKSDTGGREIRFKLIKEDESYGFAGRTIDTNDVFDTESFNSISFALDSGNTTTALHLRNVEIEMGEHITLPEWFTSIERIEAVIPNKFSLSQNFPNPFNPVTKIKYAVPVNSYISLIVYNILGQKVATLFEGRQKAGSYTVLFDGKSLSTGVYFYRLVSKGFTETKKLILLK